MRGIVDRIENGIVVVETDTGMLDLPVPQNFQHLQDGDFVEIEAGQIISVDRAAAQARRARMQARLNRLLNK